MTPHAKALCGASVALVLLLGCTPKPAPAPQNAAAPAPTSSPTGLKIDPGEWRTVVTTLELSNPEIPPETLAQVKAEPFVHEECVATDDIAQFTAGPSEESADCGDGGLTAADGKVGGQSTCKLEDGPEITHAFDGTYTQNRIDIMVTTTGETPKGKMSSKAEIVAERLGPCEN